MKLKYINEIADTCCEFMNQVININEQMPKNMLMTHIQDVCNNYTQQADDTIDIDYKNMCFTVYMRGDGLWELCENATYYIFNNTRTCVNDAIDVELI